MSNDIHAQLLALAKSGVQQLQPYQPGKPVEELERELGIEGAVKLASNENPLGISEVAKGAAIQSLAEGARYPDGSGYYLKRRLASQLQVDTTQLTLGNGSNDILELVARAFLSSEHNAVISQHAFVVYKLAITEQQAEMREIPARNWGHDLAAMAAAVDENTRVMYVANPNNPTGTWNSFDEIKTLLDSVPASVIVVIDEAYFEYVDKPEYASALALVSQYPNLIVTRTFSKAYGLAALRTGYSVSHPAVADLLNRLRQPFNVNSAALAAADAVLQDQDYLQRSIEINRVGYEQLAAGFDALSLPYIPSAGNFIAVEVGDAPAVYQELLKQGVIVRPVGLYDMPQHLRVSIGLPEENERCLAALKNIIECKAA
jgi:histidinol-phosphate aminotransferase